MSRQGTAKRVEIEAAEPQEINQAWAASMLPRRSANAHKWAVGGVVVVAGSPPYAGAAAMCCAAAGRSGAGIVSAALTRSIAHVVVGLVPEATVVILPEGESSSVARRAADAIAERLERSMAMIVGPGLGTDEAAAALLGALFGFTRVRGSIGFGAASPDGNASGEPGVIARLGKPVVVDADALNWLSGQDQWWDRVPHELLVLTPHAGEMARLLTCSVDDVLADPVSAAAEAAKRWGQTVVLKGGRTLVASPDGSVLAVESPPSLATAGSGDVLSGSIGAFLAQGLGGRDAAALAVFVGSLAARRVERKYGSLGVVAGDLPDAIGEELCLLEGVGTGDDAAI